MRIESLRLDGAWSRHVLMEQPPDGHETPVECVDIPDTPLWPFHRLTGDEHANRFTREIDLSVLPKKTPFRAFLSIPGTCSKTEILLNGQCLLPPSDFGISFRRDITEQLSIGKKNASLEMTLYPGGHCWGAPVLEVVPVPGITAVIIRPDPLRKRAMVEVTVDGPAEDLEVTVRVPETGLEASGIPGVFELSLPTAPRWSPDHPALLTLYVELRSRKSKLIDRAQKQWGLRDLTVQDRRLYLNGYPFFLRAATLHLEALRALETGDTGIGAGEIIREARNAGLNALWIRGGQTPEFILEACDQAGLCVIEDWPDPSTRQTAPATDPAGPDFEAAFQARQHHPALCCWTVTAGAPTGREMPSETFASTIQSVRKQDPSRLILAGFDRSTAERFLVKPYQTTGLPLEIIRFETSSPLSRDEERRLRHAGADKAVNMVWLSSPGHATPRKDSHPDIYQALALSFRGEDGPQAVRRDLQCDTISRTIDAITLNPKLAGYVIDPLVETGEKPGIGLLDRHGHPLPVLGALRDAQLPVRPIIHFAQDNLTPRQECGLQIFTANWTKNESAGELHLQIQSPSGQILWKKRRGIRYLPRHRQPMWEGTIAASGATGTHHLRVSILGENQSPVETRRPFYVVKPAARFEGRVHVLDQNGRYTETIRKLAVPGTLLAPVHIIVPFSNSLAGYPDNALAQMLAQVRGGAVALMFSPPSDWDSLTEIADIPELGEAFMPSITGQDTALFCPMIHPVFEGLSGSGEVLYMTRNLLPRRVYRTGSIEHILTCYMPSVAGSLDTWSEYHGIVVKHLGAGLIAFITLPLLDYLDVDPVADRLFVNLLTHFSRRSVPPDKPLPPESRVVEWIRQANEQRARAWRFIGPFPNWSDRGILEPFPPEQELQFNGIYPGSHLPVMWRSHCVPTDTTTRLNFSEVIGESLAPADWSRFTAYAWAEIEVEKRCFARLEARSSWPFRVWVNDTPAISQIERETSFTTPAWQSAECVLRPGRNTLLVKAAKTPGPALTVELRLDAPESRKLAFLSPL